MAPPSRRPTSSPSGTTPRPALSSMPGTSAMSGSSAGTSASGPGFLAPTPAPTAEPSSATRLRRLFLEGFSVMDVAEPLVSVDAERGAGEVRELLEARDFDLVGVRWGGLVRGFARREELTFGTCGQHLQPFGPDDLVSDSAPLRDAILSLGSNRRCFVTVLGQASAIVTLDDLEKPAVRMFLFGMITLLEGQLTRTIRRRLGEEGWRELVAPARLAKAEALLAERQRRGQPGGLVDCLQLSDKGQLLLASDLVKLGGGPEAGLSKKQVKRQLSALETLRNNLAHTQLIIPDGWESIVEFSARIDLLLAREEWQAGSGGTGGV